MGTSIEWTDETWNPVSGCDRVSAGCDSCYALTMARRLKAMGHPKYQRDGDPRTSGPGFGVTTHPDVLDQPLKWRKPRRIFVNSMSDLFHDAVSDGYIARVFDVMMRTPQHTYQILTKRHGRMRSLLRKWSPITGAPPWVFTGPWPLPNVWLGVSVEDQKRADLRIPALMDTPAAVRFISAEPLLGPVDLRQWLPMGGGEFRKDLASQVPLDDQQSIEGNQERLHVTNTGHLPGADRLPAVPLRTLLVPPDPTSMHGERQPLDQLNRRAVDGDDSRVLSVGAPTPLDVPLSVEQASDVPQGGRVLRHLDTGRAKALPLSSSDTGLDHSAAYGLARDTELRCNLHDGEPGDVGVDQRVGIGSGVGHARQDTRTPTLDWIVCGGESGPGARPMHPDWARSLRDQCQAAGVPFLFKQWGEHVPVPVEDDPKFAGGRAFTNPRGGSRSAAVIREPAAPNRHFEGGRTRLMEPGDETVGGVVMLDADTIAVRVGKKFAGRELDGRTWDEFPAARELAGGA